MGAKRLIVLFFLLTGSILPTFAQANAFDFFSVDTLVTNWFKPGLSFSATMTIQVESPKYTGTYTLDAYMQGAAFRADGSLTNISSADVNDDAVKLATGFGLGRQINIVRTDTREKIVLWIKTKARRWNLWRNLPKPETFCEEIFGNQRQAIRILLLVPTDFVERQESRSVCYAPLDD